MKKIISLCLAVVLALSLCLAAYEIPTDEVYDILANMSIMTYTNGSFGQDNFLTRAQLTKIVVMTSEYRGQVSNTSKTSPFSDVSFKHWCAPYVTVALVNDIMSGYTDGSFRPEQNVKYEEAISAILKLLGYKKDDFIGGYPGGHMAVANDIDLTDGVNLKLGDIVRRGDMATLIYNALNTKLKNDTKKLAEKLGYTISSNVFTLSDVINVDSKGPVTYMQASMLAGLGLNNPKVYIDGKSAAVGEIKPYSVFYYNTNSNTVFVYTERVTGTVSSILPNKELPASIVINGKTYELSTYTARKAFSVDGIEVNAVATCLLDKNGKVADAYHSSVLYTEQVGVVIGYGVNEDGNFLRTLLTTGDFVDVNINYNGKNSVGMTARISYKGGNMTVTTTSYNGALSGEFNSSRNAFGKENVAPGINILEINEYGAIIRVPASRLDGVKIESKSVLLHTRNGDGEIDNLILRDVTNDMNLFGRVTNVPKTQGTGSITCTIDIGGYVTSATIPSPTRGLDTGASMFIQDGTAVNGSSINGGAINGGAIKDIETLEIHSGKAASLSYEYVEFASGERFKISPNVLVYRNDKGLITPTTIKEAVEKDYTVNAVCYDKKQSEGGLVRVIMIAPQ